jgi:hypothetical protein
MVSFALVRDKFDATDIVFCNLECRLYRLPGGHAVEHGASSPTLRLLAKRCDQSPQGRPASLTM